MLRDAEWLIPVTDDPARRRAVIAEHWKTVSADRLPLDEQEFWAETAARRVAPADLPRLAETLAKVGEETRIRFFATCAAECKHRSLRRIALADLAAHRPDVNTIDRMVRLIEAAPTWASDRAQGARVLLLAIAAGTLPGSQSQRLTWTWKLARASRETQYRAATAASPAIRDLLRTLASSRGEEHHVRARLLVASLRQAELPVAAAALAAALTHDAIAARTIELARAELGADLEELAAAFASNLPEQKAEPPAKARRTRKKRKDRPVAAAQAGAAANGTAGEAEPAEGSDAPADAGSGEAVPAAGAPVSEGAPARKRRRRRRRRKGARRGGAGDRARERRRAGGRCRPGRRRRAGRACSRGRRGARRPRSRAGRKAEAAHEARAGPHGRAAGGRGRGLPERRTGAGEAEVPSSPAHARRHGRRVDRAPRRSPRTAERGSQGHHPGRRVGHAAIPGHAGRLQAAAARLRQADDLLPAEHADARGHPRDPRDHDAARRAGVRAACSATAPTGASSSRTPTSRVPTGSPRRS